MAWTPADRRARYDAKLAAMTPSQARAAKKWATVLEFPCSSSACVNVKGQPCSMADGHVRGKPHDQRIDAAAAAGAGPAKAAKADAPRTHVVLVHHASGWGPNRDQPGRHVMGPYIEATARSIASRKTTQEAAWRERSKASGFPHTDVTFTVEPAAGQQGGPLAPRPAPPHHVRAACPSCTRLVECEPGCNLAADSLRHTCESCSKELNAKDQEDHAVNPEPRDFHAGPNPYGYRPLYVKAAS